MDSLYFVLRFLFIVQVSSFILSFFPMDDKAMDICRLK
jgi:hypothetical protein